MTTPEPICDETELPEGAGEGIWRCSDTGSIKACFYICSKTGVKTQASASCAKSGGRKNKWAINKPKNANCVPCSTSPS